MLPQSIREEGGRRAEGCESLLSELERLTAAYASHQAQRPYTVQFLGEKEWEREWVASDVT